MPLEKRRIEGVGGTQRHRPKREFCDNLERDCILDRRAGVASPRERSVHPDEHGWHLERFEAERLNALGDDVSRPLLVVALDLVRGECAGDGDSSIEVVGVRCPEARDRTACLRPRGGERRMGMNDPAYLEAAIQHPMRGRVG